MITAIKRAIAMTFLHSVQNCIQARTLLLALKIQARDIFFDAISN